MTRMKSLAKGLTEEVSCRTVKIAAALPSPLALSVSETAKSQSTVYRCAASKVQTQDLSFFWSNHGLGSNLYSKLKRDVGTPKGPTFKKRRGPIPKAKDLLQPAAKLHGQVKKY